MDFSQKYHLVELLPGGGVESYRARQTSTGRDVTVHLLVGGKTPENEALLARLRAMQPQSMAKLIEVGEHQGNTFVVTVAPPYERLDDWLAEQDRAAAAAKEFGKAGFWKRPEAGSLAPPVAAPQAPEPGEFTKQFQRPAAAAPVTAAATQLTPPGRPAAGSSPEAGEFTRMFQSPAAAPSEVGAPPVSATTTQLTPPGRPAAGSSPEAGEFTRMFQSPVVAPPPVSATTTQLTPPGRPAAGEFTRMFQSPVVAPPPVSATTTQLTPPGRPAAGSSPEAGEFTRMFQSPVVAPAAAPFEVTGQEASPTAGAGEFTRMFQSPMPDVPAQGDWPPVAAKPPEAGEFTRMFQAPASPLPEAAPTGGEFTRFYQPSPGGVPAGPEFPSASQFPQAAQAPAPPPPQQELGEYTRMFGPGALSGAPPVPAPQPAAQAPPAAYGPGGGATQAFRAAPGYTPAHAPQGPSEYTRMMSAPSNLGTLPPAGAPPAGPMPGMPQMPYLQPPAMPQQPVLPQMPYMAPPQVTVPPVAAPAGKSSNTLPIVIFCLLAFLAGGIIVYLLVRRG